MLLDRAQEAPAAMRFHDCRQPLRLERRDRRKAFGDELAVTAMAAEDVILRAKRQRGTDRGALLTDREVGGTLVGELDAGIGAARLEGGEHRLEFADDEHRPQQLDQPGIAIALALVIERRR